ncbi:MAG: DUF2304 domain-containing protein [Acidimicrobiia bacterium]|nr:DUF2304 domain-containing protein [Acidimicrobiia bacterium]
MSARAHVLVLLVVLSSIAFLLRMVRRRQLQAKYALLWLSAGVVLLLLAASPQLLDRASIWLGISYGPTTFFLGAITLLFLVVIHFSWELSRLEDRTRVLAEELAVLRAEGAPPESRAHDGV